MDTTATRYFCIGVFDIVLINNSDGMIYERFSTHETPEAALAELTLHAHTGPTNVPVGQPG